MCVCGKQWGEHDRFPQSAASTSVSQAVHAQIPPVLSAIPENQKLVAAPAFQMDPIDNDFENDMNAASSYETTAAGLRSAISRHGKSSSSKKAVSLPKKSLTKALSTEDDGDQRTKKAVSKKGVANTHEHALSSEEQHIIVVLPSAVSCCYEMETKCELTYKTAVYEVRGVAYNGKPI
jgi:hypothetical protein